ncbi:MAG TPA: hypothetical protein DEO70_02195 [Bacteroidales bacterium]|nr:MAG: hypothetical protein A2X11_05890 [Bacteroidetes bacterium GWE2_42_24]OFY28331.1 MAG: hypothetical protein A2X09_14600 [Bacteroidetes bacterium GWF2_43_11]PKP24096.1 MAG: hypothetical protein CVU06_05330 [Bacteroidetes bacterium HGW-Bacteroidetes-22]HBZ65619.1 hypothetical protein [Bacteroidales bacterium]
MIRLTNLYNNLIPGRVPPDERHTFKLHLAYSLVEGIILGVLALNEYVFLRSMQGNNYLMSILFQSSMVVFLLLIFFNEFINRSPDKRKLLRITAIVTRGPLMLLFFFPSNETQLSGSNFYHIAFLLIFLIYYMGNPVIYPTINHLLKNSYSHQHFGRFYSLTQSYNKAVMMVITLVYGIWLDVNPFAFRWVFPVVSLAGVGSIWLLSAIKPATEQYVAVTIGFLQGVRQSVFRMTGILRTDRPYRHFQIGMMFYGFSFMISITIINIFFREGLNLNYTSVALYKNFYNIEAIFLLPWFGRMIGRIDPRVFGIITFASLLGYVLFLQLTNMIRWKADVGDFQLYVFLMCAFLVYGFYAAGMALLWNIGSAYFCTPDQSGDYQSVHLFLTAVRALFAPLFGVWVYEAFGFSATFLLTAFSLVIAIAILWASYRNDKKPIGNQ